ncbi:MAG TPA: hypothetical protein DDW50_21940 [Firmicutes bacterium]|jgi:hypothetical protein|nr:hypothetical protein [Bacillota bacterium]
MRGQAIQANDQVTGLIKAGKNVEAAQLLADKAAPINQELLVRLEKLISLANINRNNANKSVADTFAVSDSLQVILALVCIGFGLVGIF